MDAEMPRYERYGLAAGSDIKEGRAMVNRRFGVVTSVAAIVGLLATESVHGR
jgi:hypothetical protein